MGLMTCGCLNVKIHVKSTDLNQVQSNDVEGQDPSAVFFQQRLAFAHLNLEGVEEVHTCLIIKQKHGSWITHRCTNCQLWTHAIHCSQPSKVLVNLCLHTDPTSIHVLERDVDFSTLYKVILRDQNANRVGTVGVESQKYESLQLVLAKIQHQLNKFLMDQENNMENRIKRYAESQRVEFAELQRKARQDKNTLIHLILAVEQDSIQSTEKGSSSPNNATKSGSPKGQLNLLAEDSQVDHTAPAMATQNTHVSAAGPTSKPTIGFQTKSGNSSAKPPIVQASHNVSKSRGFTRSASALTQKLGAVHHKPTISSDPEAALFEMDPTFSDDVTSSEPFYHSDDEQDDTDDSEIDTPPPNLNMFSTSVPISVPTFSKKKITFAAEDRVDNDMSPLEDPDDIAASIKALARSVHGDGKAIFGDLPRPRFNPSADFSNV